MLEQWIARALQQMADKEQPQSRISAQQAIRDGRARLRRRRRIAAVGTPAFAAVAVLAIAVSSSNLSAGSQGAGPQPASPASAATARHFSALSPYATFGWLPAKEPVIPGHKKVVAKLGTSTNDWIDTVSESLTSGPWTLEAYAIGACHQVGNQLHCGDNNPGWTAADQRADSAGTWINPNFCAFSREVPAPPVNGHHAFWLAGSGAKCLNWEYAPGGWASLNHFSEIRPGKQLVLRIASAIRFGGHQPSLKFAAQLRKLPGKWRVVIASFAGTNGALLDGDYTLWDGATSIDLEARPTNSKHNQCAHSTPQSSAAGCRVINGYAVNYKKPPTPSCHRGSACAAADNFASIFAPDADGLRVSLMAGRRDLGLLFKVFAHMTMLGKNPAAWTTKPIS